MQQGIPRVLGMVAVEQPGRVDRLAVAEASSAVREARSGSNLATSAERQAADGHMPHPDAKEKYDMLNDPGRRRSFDTFRHILWADRVV